MAKAAFALPLIGLLAASTGVATPQTGERRSCIDFERVVAREATAPDRIEFTLVGGRRYASVLPDACPNLQDLDRFHTLQIERREGSRVCVDDRFRMINPATLRAGGVRAFPVCRFGPFVELAPRR